MILENGFCTKCGHRLNDDDLYCPECGMPQFTAVVEETPKKKLWLYFLVPFVISAVVATIALLFNVYAYLFVFIPFIFIGGKRGTKKGNAVSGLFAGASVGIIIGMILTMCGISLV